MKKITATLLMIAVLIGMLVSCGKKMSDDNGLNELGLPKGMSGIDAAKLILANERLNSQLFKNTDSIFNSGATAFASLYDLAEINMVKYSGTMQEATLLSANYTDENKVSSLGSLSSSGVTFISNKNHTLSNGSTLKVDGNVYRWSNFGEYSNSYDYFLNITNNVKSSAEIGARLIDDTKKFVRIVDTWVKIDNNEYYLHVEDDTEIIYCRSAEQSEICRRYKRADGINVYEVYKRSANGSSSRMVYIPGEKYEYSHIFQNFNHNFLAENTKGFWEVVDVGKTDWGYNVSCMVLKDDICYDSFYNPESQETHYLKVISSDKKTDIMDISIGDGSASIVLKLQAFKGVNYVEMVTDNVLPLEEEFPSYDKFVYRYDVPENPQQKEHTVYFAGTNACTLVLKNGSSIKSNDEFLDGKVLVNGITANHVSMEGFTDGYTADLQLQIYGETYDEIISNLEEFLSICGLSCTRNFKTVKSGIIQAYTELAQMTKYHTWNESPIRSLETLDKGYSNNLAKHKQFTDMLNTIKDAEVIDFKDKDIVELKIKFAPITSQTSGSVKNSGLSVNVSNFALSIEDTTLFVVGEKYKVNFAIIETSANSNMGLVHVETGEGLSVNYTDQNVFTVNQTTSFEIPVLTAGEYTVVAYISTEDGIRSSGYQNVIFTDVQPYETKQGNINVVIDKNKKGELSITNTIISEIEVNVELPESTTHSYSEMFSALENQAYLYGFVEDDALLEVSTDQTTWTTLTGDETSLESGTYRLKYSVKNGNTTFEGYVYTVYTVSE